MRTRVLADGPKPKKTHKKYDENIGRHLKKKKIGTPKVFQRLYVFHLYAQRNHSLSFHQGTEVFFSENIHLADHVEEQLHLHVQSLE
jgi:hypothetical protein